MKKKLKVVVLMGGKTPEHEISLISGQEVIKSLDTKKYEVLPVVILKDGKGFNKLRKENADIIFIAMHGPFGEDGTVQGMLELAGLKYTGSGVLASALGMDKVMFRKVLKSQDIPVPKYLVVEKGQKIKGLEGLGKPPYFVKPSNQGSSVGASIVKNRNSLKKALKRAFEYSDKALVEEFIKGKEVTCTVLGNKKPKALPLVEVIPKNEFFDYESKYCQSGTQEIVPARISKTLTRKVQELAVKVYKALDAKGFSRIDFLLKDDKFPIVLEINTIPGLTPMSLLPKAAKAAGYSYSQLLDRIIEYATQES